INRTAAAGSAGLCRAPRASGDNPCWRVLQICYPSRSPRQRGYTGRRRREAVSDVEFPAPAGINHHITRYLFLKFLY
ncbi:hypothetical protein, partial [Escherichia coli]|uniref:hypothetical protein n=1 Tax=Escherichia coli TaxID=562 RepID=UPI002FBECA4B